MGPPESLTGNAIGPIQAPQFATRIRPAILTAIGLPILTTILAAIQLTIFPAVLPSTNLTIFSPVFPPIQLPVLSTVFSSINATIFPAIFLADVIGLGNVHMISAIAPAIHGPRAAVQRPWPAIE